VRDNPIQFAVVREDPLVEEAVLRRANATRALLIASGGCTALSLASRLPDLEIALVDPNGAQLDHVRAKIAALDEPIDLRRFNVGDRDPRGLNACGNFESLFRTLREVVWDLVLPEEEWHAFFAQPEVRTLAQIFENRYWPVAFELAFADAFLHAMFGPAATQHAIPGSYPSYFRKLFERGLSASGAGDNYFLHHVFCGCYLRRALPEYLSSPPRAPRFEMIHGTLADVRDLERFDLVSLSNITDWMSRDEIAALARTLRDRLRRSAKVLFRQLNNDSDLPALFPGLRFDRAFGEQLLAADRSLFYSSIAVAERA